MKFKNKVSISAILFFGAILCATTTFGQKDKEPPTESVYKDPLTIFWINTYGNIRVSDRFFWIAQTHFRFQETEATPFAGQIAQLYNRHAISYLHSKKFNISLGGVLRINFNTDEILDNEQSSVPEWRIWHQYQWAVPVNSMMVYHRIRLEHRWTRSFQENSEYIFRNRWRYMLKFKIPLNTKKIGPKTLYVSPESEIILQSGKKVIDSPLEDLRLHNSFGYVINPRVTVAAGVMYSFGQDIKDGAFYKQKWALRFHVYYSPDFRKTKNKLPAIHFTD